MDDLTHSGPMRFFAQIEDPRASNVQYRLPDLFVMALCAVICGADGWRDMAMFAQAKASWFGTFLNVTRGTPSADTFRRVFSRIDPDAFERCFTQWMQVVSQAQGELVAIDGKSLRHSFEHAWDKSGMAHMVSAFAEHNGQVIAQCKAAGTGHELAAIAQLLGLLELDGATVTIDALGTQKAIAKQIIDQGGDYILCVKENQPTLHAAIQVELDDMIRCDFHDLPYDRHQDVDAGHGRIETRTVWTTDQLHWLKQRSRWTGLKSVVVVEAQRDIPLEETSVERRYFISSLPPDAAAFAHAIRSHWHIENRLHYVLDVSFAEDDSRIRREHGPENMSRLRRLALNLLREQGNRHTKCKSIKGRRKLAGWDHDFLLKLITT